MKMVESDINFLAYATGVSDDFVREQDMRISHPLGKHTPWSTGVIVRLTDR
jgi:hypothetical protein